MLKSQVADVVAWNALMTGYILAKQHHAVLQLFEEMKQTVQPDDITLMAVFSGLLDN